MSSAAPRNSRMTIDDRAGLAGRMARRLLSAAAATTIVIAAMAGAAWPLATAGGATTAKVDQAFKAKADGVCRSLHASLSQVLGTKFPYPKFNPVKPDRATMKKVGAYYHKALPIDREIPAKLDSLGSPATGKQTWDQLKKLVDQSNALAIRQQRLASAGNVKGFVANVNATGKLLTKIDVLGKAAGFTKASACAAIFG